MHSVLLLIVSFGGLAGLYVLLDAPFTAVTQIIVYAGAIMVLFLFVVMLLNAHTEDEVVPVSLGPHAMKLGRAALGGAGDRARGRRCRGSAWPSFSDRRGVTLGDQQRRDASARCCSRPTRSRSK